VHFRGLDLNLLVALDALLAEANVTAAGRKLHLSQSAMSGTLARLREHFHDPLLVQVGRRMQPTPYARQLAGTVRSILVQIDASLSGQAPFEPRTAQRRLRIAASDYAIDVLLLAVQRFCATAAPGLVFDIVPVAENAVAALNRGELDLLILPDRYRQSSCPSVPLFADRLVCVAARDNPLRGDMISLRAFKTAEHVLFQPDPGHVIAFDLWLQQNYNFEPAVKLLLPNYASLPHAVAGTNRIATIPERLARRFAEHLPIRILQPRFRMPALNEIMQWHEAHSSDAGLTWVRQLIVDAAASLDAPAEDRRTPGAP
jgi:LysR family transcriptional regulator, nod-box dependent transcriptional activator